MLTQMNKDEIATLYEQGPMPWITEQVHFLKSQRHKKEQWRWKVTSKEQSQRTSACADNLGLMALHMIKMARAERNQDKRLGALRLSFSILDMLQNYPLNAGIISKSIKRALEEKESERAMTYSINGLTQHPGNRLLLLQQAQVYGAQGRGNISLQILEGLDRQDGQSKYLRAYYAYNLGKLDQAENQTKDIIKDINENAESATYIKPLLILRMAIRISKGDFKDDPLARAFAGSAYPKMRDMAEVLHWNSRQKEIVPPPMSDEEFEEARIWMGQSSRVSWNKLLASNPINRSAADITLYNPDINEPE